MVKLTSNRATSSGGASVYVNMNNIRVHSTHVSPFRVKIDEKQNKPAESFGFMSVLRHHSILRQKCHFLHQVLHQRSIPRIAAPFRSVDTMKCGDKKKHKRKVEIAHIFYEKSKRVLKIISENFNSRFPFKFPFLYFDERIKRKMY